jgi:hypothetical protein
MTVWEVCVRIGLPVNGCDTGAQKKEWKVAQVCFVEIIWIQNLAKKQVFFNQPSKSV